MTDRTENASSVHPSDILKALKIVESAARCLRLALDDAEEAHKGKHDEELTEIYLYNAGSRRDVAREDLEDATRILARLNALRD